MLKILFRKIAEQNETPGIPVSKLHLILSAIFIFMLKFKFEIFKISQYILRQSRDSPRTINNIELLFIKFTYICIYRIFYTAIKFLSLRSVINQYQPGGLSFEVLIYVWKVIWNAGANLNIE